MSMYVLMCVTDQVDLSIQEFNFTLRGIVVDDNNIVHNTQKTFLLVIRSIKTGAGMFFSN